MHHSIAIILIRENEIILKSTLLPVFWKQTGYKPKKKQGCLGENLGKKTLNRYHAIRGYIFAVYSLGTEWPSH